MDDFRKSINAVLYERLTSPLFGTFVLSWLVWNWKIPYVTFFVSEEHLEMTKIEFISVLIQSHANIIAYPIISTFLIILVVPLFSNGAYWISLLFEKWKYDKKNEVENKKMLPVEKSVELKKKVRELEFNYLNEIEKKNEEIKALKEEVLNLSDKINKKISDKAIKEYINSEQFKYKNLPNTSVLNN